jgi:hypothetical protein
LFGYAASEAVVLYISFIIPDNRRDEETVIVERIKQGEQMSHERFNRLCAVSCTSEEPPPDLIVSAGNAVWRSRESHARLGDGMDDSWVVLLQYLGKTPAMASCAKCRLKFFTPSELLKKPREATDYLRGKFAAHPCKWEEAISSDHPRHLRVVTSNIGICDGCEARFMASAYLRDHPRQAESDVRRKFGRHACSRSNAA